VRWDGLVGRDGLYFKKFTDTRFTGKVRGKKQGKMKDGILEGERVNYFENGQLRYKGSYKNGLREGEWTFYHDNGQLYGKGSYKNGKKEGEWVDYRKDGTVNSERSGTFKNGKTASD
jgi:antitoxin component YwqK of YwqJK toxin-antitoxin module